MVWFVETFGGKILKSPLPFPMGKLKSHGGFSDDAVTAAKAAMIAENFDFSEEIDTKPSARSGNSTASFGGFIEQHFNFDRKK